MKAAEALHHLLETFPGSEVIWPPPATPPPPPRPRPPTKPWHCRRCGTVAEAFYGFPGEETCLDCWIIAHPDDPYTRRLNATQEERNRQR